jgi:hypothetical protein
VAVEGGREEMNVETNEHPLERDAAGPARVIMTLNVKETSELADDLRALCALACDGGGMDEETARVVDRVTTLAQLLQRQLGHLAQPAARTEEADMGTMLAPRQDHPQEALGAFKGIPVEHVEWALKVYRLTASHSRASVNATLERVFEKGEEPFDETDHQVDYIMSPLSIVSRMTSDAFLSLWTNSVLVDLKARVVDIYKE